MAALVVVSFVEVVVELFVGLGVVDGDDEVSASEETENSASKL